MVSALYLSGTCGFQSEKENAIADASFFAEDIYGDIVIMPFLFLFKAVTSWWFRSPRSDLDMQDRWKGSLSKPCNALGLRSLKTHLFDGHRVVLSAVMNFY